MPGGGDERNQRGAGGSGQATPPDGGCVEPGQALAAGGCIGGGSGHWAWDRDWTGGCD
jgi:hypothetical protein